MNVFFCMVLSYVRPPNNLSTGATGCLLVSFGYFRRPVPSISLLFGIVNSICQSIGEIKGFVDVVIIN